MLYNCQFECTASDISSQWGSDLRVTVALPRCHGLTWHELLLQSTVVTDHFLHILHRGRFSMQAAWWAAGPSIRPLLRRVQSCLDSCYSQLDDGFGRSRAFPTFYLPQCSKPSRSSHLPTVACHPASGWSRMHQCRIIETSKGVRSL